MGLRMKIFNVFWGFKLKNQIFWGRGECHKKSIYRDGIALKSVDILHILHFPNPSVIPWRHRWKYLYLHFVTCKQVPGNNFLGQVFKVKFSLRKKEEPLETVPQLTCSRSMWVAYTKQRINQLWRYDSMLPN